MIGVTLAIQTVLNGLVFHNQDLYVGKGRRFLTNATNPVACVEESSEIGTGELVLRLGAALMILVLSGTFSGLTLGLLGLDLTGLDIVIKGDPTSKEAQYAKKIYPLRKDGNLLLCTLLLGNVAVNAMLSILIAEITSGMIGFAVSTIFIVIFGEIIPQATFSRHALYVGASTIPIVKAFIVLMYVAAKPLAMVLDRVLGEELGTVHTRRQLIEIVKFHGQQELLDNDEVSVMTGAMSYAKKPVKDVMTHKKDVFMLPVTQTLDFNTISLIFQRGFSRIPVYENSKDNVVGILFTKDLILLDPEDNVSIRSVIHFFSRSVMKVRTENTLSQVLGLFKSGRCHLAIVVDAAQSKVSDMHDPIFIVVGIITIEDIIEDILQTEISDETDEFVNIAKRNRNQNRNLFDIHRLALLDPHKVEEKLTSQEVTVIATHLLHNVDVFKSGFTRDLVETLVRKSKVLTVRKKDVEDSRLRELYKRGHATNVCTFVIEGKVDVTVGTEGFRSQLGKFQIIARKALTSFPKERYTPDFTAIPDTCDGMCRFLRIYASDFYNLLNPSEEISPDLPRTSFDLKHDEASSTSVIKASSSSSMVKTPLELKHEEEEKENDERPPEFTALEIDESQMKKKD